MKWGLTPAWQALRREWMLYHMGDQRFRFMFDAPPENEWVSVDCETTGLNVGRDEIISIGAVRIVGDRILTSQRLELIVKPSKGVCVSRTWRRGWTPTRRSSSCCTSSAAARWWATTSNSTSRCSTR
jgi:DNA polymerase-3 subunit epsilon